MALDIIQSSYDNIDVTNIVPSFLSWVFGGALNMNPALFGIGLLMIIAVVTLLIFKNNGGFEVGAVTSSIITLISALMFVKAGWINQQVLFITFVYLAFALYFLFKERSAVEA